MLAVPLDVHHLLPAFRGRCAVGLCIAVIVHKAQGVQRAELRPTVQSQWLL